MARKYDLISELYNRTCKTVVSNPQNWQAFLASACRNYKLRYDEQLLVYAQRPDATAVLEIEQWNKIFGRWVNRGARGIAVFADENRTRQRLTHYFDISDTHESKYSRTVPIWDMRQEYEADVIETLESTFGEIENKSSLAEAIMGAARNAAEDNIPDYLQDLYYATEGSFLEEVDNDIVASIYKNVVANSVAYMMMSRLGVDTDGYFELDDFRDVTNFNTQETLNALGFATSDIAEMGLTEISKTITAFNRQNRIIVGQDRNEYNKVENNDERSLDNERTDLHNGGRLQPSEPETSTAAGSDFGQIRSDEEKVSEGTSQSPLLQSPDEGRTDTALGGSGTESQQDGGNNSEPDGTERGSDRTDESRGYDEMGLSDELPSQLGTGNRESGSDIRLEYYDRTHEDKSLPFFGRDEVINEILRKTPHLSASLEEIKDYYERNPDNKDRTEYIKSIFNNDIFQGMSDKSGSMQEQPDENRNGDINAGKKTLPEKIIDMSGNGASETRDILYQSDKYTVQKVYDSRLLDDYIELWGTLDNGNFILIRTPIQGIKDNVHISNTFITYIGIVTLIIGIIAAFVLSSYISKPIKQLSNIAERMSELDFDIKYDGKDKGEIGLLGKSMNNMSQKLEENISQLKTANLELQRDIDKKEKLEKMRTDFLSNVSHELKTPIALIQGYAEGLKEGITDDPESMDFYCSVIMDEAAKMNNMVKRLLTLNQIEFGEDELVMERFDINELVKSVVNANELRATQKNLSITYDILDTPLYVWADEYKVEEVVTNYLSNAINHCCNENIIKIKVGHIDKDNVRVSVFNTGNNIPEADIEHIWEKFYKVDKARTREYGGNGIGLSIVKAIVESMGKTCGVNNLSDGVEFWFDLDCKL